MRLRMIPEIFVNTVIQNKKETFFWRIKNIRRTEIFLIFVRLQNAYFYRVEFEFPPKLNQPFLWDPLDRVKTLSLESRERKGRKDSQNPEDSKEESELCYTRKQVHKYRSAHGLSLMNVWQN